MTEGEKIFFKMIEERSKDNPMIKVELAAQETAAYTMEFYQDEQGRVSGDSWLYLLATMSGIACAKLSKDIAVEMFMDGRIEDEMLLPLVTVTCGAEAEKVYYGDAINECLYNNRFSIFNVFYKVFSNRNPNVKLPDIKTMINNNVNAMADDNYKVWNNMHDPKKDKDEKEKVYQRIIEHVKPFNLEKKQIPAMFGLALVEVVTKVANVFPKELNCYEMMVETIIYNAHMDY